MGCGSSKAADVAQKATAELTTLHAAAIAKAPQQTEDVEPSPHADAREDETITAKIDFVLASHISAVLGIDPSSPEIKKYVSVLRHQGDLSHTHTHTLSPTHQVSLSTLLTLLSLSRPSPLCHSLTHSPLHSLTPLTLRMGYPRRF